METLKLVCLDWISQERDKYIWEDLYAYSWDEIIGRMYLLKVHAQAANGHYEAALFDLEQALSLFMLNSLSSDASFYLWHYAKTAYQAVSLTSF